MGSKGNSGEVLDGNEERGIGNYSGGRSVVTKAQRS